MTEPLQALTDDARWALVTGASAGLGKEFCRQLAADGYHLVLVARRADRLHALASELREQHGTACLVLASDLSRPEAPAEIFRAVQAENIVPEFLVNNAGYGVPGRLVEVDWPVHRDFIQVMITGLTDLAWRFLPGMQDAGKGYIINLSSVAGLVPGSEAHTLYAASKAYVIKFSESLSLEAARHGVVVSALCPGFTYTEFHDVTGSRERVSKMPGYLWLDAEEVVAYGIDAVKRKRPRLIAVPGRIYQVLVWVARTFPGIGRAIIKARTSSYRDLGDGT